MARPERAAGGVGGLGACQSAVLSAGMPIGVPCLPLSMKQELRDLLELPGRDLTLVKCFVNLKDSHFLINTEQSNFAENRPIPLSRGKT